MDMMKAMNMGMSRDSPDFKGIKTVLFFILRKLCSPGTALISKGLRHEEGDIGMGLGSRDSPDFKGI